MGAYPNLLAAGGRNQVPAKPEPAESGGCPFGVAPRRFADTTLREPTQRVGHVDDFIIDDETWAVRYLVVDTRNWWLDKKVLVAPHWTNRISWARKEGLRGPLSTSASRTAPSGTRPHPSTREYEARLYDYYGRPVYWDSGDRPVKAPATAPALRRAAHDSAQCLARTEVVAPGEGGQETRLQPSSPTAWQSASRERCSRSSPRQDARQ